MIDIVMPIQAETEQFERTMRALDKFTNQVETKVQVLKDSTINVSECRQLALDDSSFSRYICYIDDDSEMIHDGWLDNMYQLLQSDENIGAVFGGEWWGTEDAPKIVEVENGETVTPMTGATPAACMLIDKERLTPFHHWDQNIGLRSGWLGGDFEEVDFVYRLMYTGLRCARATGTVFHHTGGKTTFRDWGRKDRAVCVNTMRTLLAYKYTREASSLDDGYFDGLQYVKADCNDDCMLAPGYTLRDCYREVITRAGLAKHPQFVHIGLV